MNKSILFIQRPHFSWYYSTLSRKGGAQKLH